MYKTIIPCTLALLLALGACNNKKQESAGQEKEYAALFDKEYGEFPASERYRLFEERYRLLLSVTEEIDKTDDPTKVTPQHIDTLCFTSPRELEMLLGEMETDGKTKTFKDYVNTSNDVNATIVTSQFFNTLEEHSEFEHEHTIHEAYEVLDKTRFFQKCFAYDTIYSHAYDEFSKARIIMDKLNHSKYLVIVKEVLYAKWEDLGERENSFLPGSYMASIYVYNIAENQIQWTNQFLATNSESVVGEKTSMDLALRDDLNNDVKKQMWLAIDTTVGIRGDLPSIKLVYPK